MAKSKFQKWLQPEGLILIEGWARDGLTDEQIAHNMGISRSTLSKWKTEYKSISDTLKKGKEVVDYIVENALFKSACGYEYDEVTREPLYDGDGRKLLGSDGKQIVATTKIVTKQVSPNATSMIYWLKNRKPDKWRDRVVTDTDKEVLDKLDRMIDDIDKLAKDE